MGAGLRPKAKGLDKPPDPTVRAPVLDPTGRGRLDSLVTKGPAAYLIATRQSMQMLGLRLRRPGGVACRRCHVQADESGHHDRQVDLPGHRLQQRDVPGEPGRRGDLRAVLPGQRRIQYDDGWTVA